MRGRLATTCAALVLAACSYDWTVGPSRDEAGPGDAATADVGPGDADAAVDCAALSAASDARRDEARRCTLAAGECATTVLDPCGCPVFVAVGGSAAANAFAEASAALVRAGCPLGCGTCPTQPVTGTCLQQPSGTFCWP